MISDEGGATAKVINYHHRNKIVKEVGVAALVAVSWWLGRGQRAGAGLFECVAIVLLGGLGFVQILQLANVTVDVVR